MQGDDYDLFLREMAGVKKLRAEQRVSLSKQAKVAEESIAARRQAALVKGEHESPDKMSSDDFIEMVHPMDVLEFCRDGVAHGVFRKLKQGKYELQARLDLHRMTVEQARDEVVRFIADCQKYDVRTAIILPGKGERGEQKAVLKSHLNKWLQEIPEVLAFSTAQKHHGGVGAFYVLMKKSPRQKERNRERFL
ncbi:DNA endonuclease SmrA [Salinibius halmophilus]|uniref:DNA endonuclease SmrA n=1 Tax=Salinibius halmophilus TaxID=1853216 RepID=UPI000E670398|nr:DNA endonuclease SmrA [Salinibius halmophilus]